jgi:hypothetical protein
MSATASTQPQVVVVPSIVDLEKSTPGILPKDKVNFPISDLFCFIAKTVDFEGLRANGMGEIKELVEKQSLDTFFNILNGPVYPELVKDFWMKAEVISRSSVALTQDNEENANDDNDSQYLGQEVRSVV